MSESTQYVLYCLFKLLKGKVRRFDYVFVDGDYEKLCLYLFLNYSVICFPVYIFSKFFNKKKTILIPLTYIIVKRI